MPPTDVLGSVILLGYFVRLYRSVILFGFTVRLYRSGISFGYNIHLYRSVISFGYTVQSPTLKVKKTCSSQTLLPNLTLPDLT